MVKVKVVIATDCGISSVSFNHPMVKVKVYEKSNKVLADISFNHPMVKVKEEARLSWRRFVRFQPPYGES